MPEAGATRVVLRPVPWGDAGPFWKATGRGELVIQRCADTGRLIFPPRPMSPWGEHRTPEWVSVSGAGRIWSFIVPHPPLMAQFADRRPFPVAVVELDEDPRARLVGVVVASPGAELDSVDPATVTIGQRVVVDLTPVDEHDFVLPRWIPTPD